MKLGSGARSVATNPSCIPNSVFLSRIQSGALKKNIKLN